jgi:carboxyl-terminal processing protease
MGPTLGINGQKPLKECLYDLTVYFNEQDVLRFKINNTGYTGIGALISQKEGTTNR